MKAKRKLVLRPDGAYDVPLTKGLFAIVDAEDAEIVGRYNWCSSQRRDGQFIAISRPSTNSRAILLHRLIIFGDQEASEPLLVDHKNGDALDCRRQNLRPATAGQNQANRKASGQVWALGVHFCSTTGKYVAKTRKDGRRIHIGYFNDVDDAARAYDEVAAKVHGEFARLNFPGSGR